MPDDSFAQFQYADSCGILISAPLSNRASDRISNPGRAINIGETLSEIDRTRFGGDGGVMGKDRGAKWLESGN